jgi:hypothetical protein
MLSGIKRRYWMQADFCLMCRNPCLSDGLPFLRGADFHAQWPSEGFKSVLCRLTSPLRKRVSSCSLLISTCCGCVVSAGHDLKQAAEHIN